MTSIDPYFPPEKRVRMQRVAKSIFVMQFQKINIVFKHSSITLQNGADDVNTTSRALCRYYRAKHCFYFTWNNSGYNSNNS